MIGLFPTKPVIFFFWFLNAVGHSLPWGAMLIAVVGAEGTMRKEIRMSLLSIACPMGDIAGIVVASRAYTSGGLVDEKALYEAVRDGVIAGAALDVTESEPIEEDNPLLTLPQVIITNHVASYSKEALDAISIMCADNVIRALSGKEVVNRVV